MGYRSPRAIGNWEDLKLISSHLCRGPERFKSVRNQDGVQPLDLFAQKRQGVRLGVQQIREDRARGNPRSSLHPTQGAGNPLKRRYFSICVWGIPLVSPKRQGGTLRLRKQQRWVKFNFFLFLNSKLGLDPGIYQNVYIPQKISDEFPRLTCKEQ